MSFRMHATKTSDGRLQLFVLGPTNAVFTLFPESNNQQFVPFQAGNPAHGDPQNIAAGCSPDGNEQIWVGTLSLSGNTSAVHTVHQTEPDHAWDAWHTFKPAGDVASICAVGQLSDGRMQAFAIDRYDFPCKISTGWKLSTQPGVGWSDWKKIAPPPDSEGNGFMSGVIVGPLSDGRLQIWAKARKNAQSKTYLYTSYQTATAPSAPWSAWEKFSTPPHHAGDETGLVGASELVDGSTHLWLVSPAFTLQSIRKTSSDPAFGWDDWKDPFHPSPNDPTPNDSFFADFAAARRHDGTCQLWKSFESGQFRHEVVVMTSRQTGSNPLDWSAWTEVGLLLTPVVL